MNDKTTTRIDDYPYEVQERAAIYEFDAGMKRDQAEARAVEEWTNNMQCKLPEKEKNAQ